MLRMRGNLGILRVGYVESVEIRDWNLTCSQEVVGEVDWMLSATVSKADGFWSTQQPTEVRLQMDYNVWWQWANPRANGVAIKGKPITLVFRGDPDIQIR